MNPEPVLLETTLGAVLGWLTDALGTREEWDELLVELLIALAHGH